MKFATVVYFCTNMKQLYIQNKFFVLPFLLLFLVCAALTIGYGNATIHLYINQFHSSFTDTIFPVLTNVGDGYTVIVVIAVLLFFRMKYALLLASSYSVASAVVQVLKRGFFYGTPRPALYFQGNHHLHYMPGIELDVINSFPSGHSATALVLFFCLALFTSKPLLKLLYFVLACLVAFSRVYISEHFFGDITAGSGIGFISVILMSLLLKKLNNNFWNASIQSLLLSIKRLNKLR